MITSNDIYEDFNPIQDQQQEDIFQEQNNNDEFSFGEDDTFLDDSQMAS